VAEKEKNKEQNEESPNWIREQFDTDPLIQDDGATLGIAADNPKGEAEDPFSTFAFESASIAEERQDMPLAPWLISPAPADGYFRACAIEDIPLNSGVGFRIYNRHIAIFRRDGDKITATDDACPHAGSPLSNGVVKNSILMCVWHGWTFDLDTGACDVNENTPIRLYPIQIRDNDIYVGILTDEARELLTSGYPYWDE